MNNLKEKYAGDLWDISDIPSNTVLRDWYEDGIRCQIVRGPCALCAYLGVPLDHPIANKNYEDIPLSVHYGLTFGSAGKIIYPQPTEYVSKKEAEALFGLAEEKTQEEEQFDKALKEWEDAQ